MYSMPLIIIYYLFNILKFNVMQYFLDELFHLPSYPMYFKETY